MKIKTYAILKDYFPAEAEYDVTVKDILELKNTLVGINPAAEGVLNLSRFAVGNCLVNMEYVLNGDELISIIPPSSGG